MVATKMKVKVVTPTNYKHSRPHNLPCIQSFISSALFATSQLVHWDSIPKLHPGPPQHTQEELGDPSQICLSLELQDQTEMKSFIEFDPLDKK